MKARSRLALVLIAVAGVAFAVVWAAIALLDDGGGVSAPPASAGQVRWTIEDAKAFDEFPLYWLGESYEGLPLKRVIRYKYEPSGERAALEFPEDVVLFIYGSCTPAGYDSGCRPPLSIRIEPYCMKPPERMARNADDAPPVEVRGVTAQADPYDVTLWTGASTITVFGDNERPALEVAGNLRSVKPDGVGAGEPLPPPDADSC